MKPYPTSIQVDFSHYIYESRAPNITPNEYFTSYLKEHLLDEGPVNSLKDFRSQHLRKSGFRDRVSIVDSKHIRREIGLVASSHVPLLIGTWKYFWGFTDKHLRKSGCRDRVSIVDSKHIRREIGLVASSHVLLLMGILLITALTLFITFLVKYLLKTDCTRAMRDSLICMISAVSTLILFAILAAFYLLHTKPRINESVVRNKINFEAAVLLESYLASK